MLARRQLLLLAPIVVLAGCSRVEPDASVGSPVTGATASPEPAASAASTPADPPEGSMAAGASVSEATRRQLDYALAHWADTASEEFGHLGDTDCVNFTSQTLLARGWEQDDGWWYENDEGSMDYSPAWISSTALAGYLGSRPDLAVALTDEQRAEVGLGDIVQFDWDLSGDRDHTGIITAVSTDASGAVRLRYACHSGGEDYYDVDREITRRHPGASVSYWHLI